MLGRAWQANLAHARVARSFFRDLAMYGFSPQTSVTPEPIIGISTFLNREIKVEM